MDCKIVFYSARKTSLCERALKKSLLPLQLSLAGAKFATSAEALGRELTDALGTCDVVFVIGGLEFGDSRSAESIIASAAARSNPSVIRRLRNENGDDGVLLCAGRQTLVLLPDEPQQLEQMMKGSLTAFLRAHTA